MPIEHSDPVSTGTGLVDDSLARARDAFASLLAGDGTQDGSEQQPNEDESSIEAQAPTDDEDDSEAADGTQDADEESDGEPEEGAATPARYTVKVDGKKQAVELPELLNGYSRLQDYTRKTQQLAEERRTFEADRQAVHQERAIYSDLLGKLEAQLTQADTPDWDKLYAEDPIAYVREQQLYQERLRRLGAVQQEKARLAEAQQREAADAVKARLAEEHSKLLAAIPQWADTAVAQRDQREIREYAVQIGFTPEEVGQIADHRAVLILRKALAYDRLQEGKAKLKDKRQVPVARTAAPGAVGSVVQSEVTKARKRLAKTGSVRDAAAVFEQLLNE